MFNYTITLILLISLIKSNINQKVDPINKNFNSSDLCPELTLPSVGVSYPWLNDRLPSNISPIEYQIELSFLDINETINYYEGTISIIVELSEETDTFVLHDDKIDSVNFVSLKDQNGKLIDVTCSGKYEKKSYFIFKTKTSVEIEASPLTLKLKFTNTFNSVQSGLFKLKVSDKDSPLFDEPNFKANFILTVKHPNNYQVLSNTKKTNDDLDMSIFEKTIKLPSYLFGLVVFKNDDFTMSELKSESNRIIRLWALKQYKDNGFLDRPLHLFCDILKTSEELLKDVPEAVPNNINIFALPSYPVEAISHWGLITLKDNKLLFKNESSSHQDEKNIALLIGKKITEFWFGNYVTFPWWNELWLQEALGDYLKYLIIDKSFPYWEIYNQFVTDQLAQILLEDSLHYSHPIIKPVNSPYEIEEYFDKIETTKAMSILRMIEYEITKEKMLESILSYLEFRGNGLGDSFFFISQLGFIRNWSAKEFTDRWFLQSNFPLLITKTFLQNDGKYYISIEQVRAVNTEDSFFNDTIYPSPFDWTWFVPLTCTFGSSSGLKNVHNFDLSTKNNNFLIGDGSIEYEWHYCNMGFKSYYEINYQYDNWNKLSELLYENKDYFEPIDRAYLLHNMFANAFADRSSYNQVSQFIKYLTNETNYVPWQMVNLHIDYILSILQYKKSFYQVSTFFKPIIQNFDIWKSNTGIEEELLQEALIEISCKLQHSNCLLNASKIWNENKESIISGETFIPNTIQPSLRHIIYNTHIQNTYDYSEWKFLLLEFQSNSDLIEKQRIIEALSYTRLPSLLSEFILLGEDSLSENFFDFFDIVKYMSRNSLGREIIFDYVRINYDKLINKYSLDDPRMGDMLIDISFSFETKFLLNELIEFFASTPIGADRNARFISLEKASLNIKWLEFKQDEIIDSFGDFK